MAEERVPRPEAFDREQVLQRHVDFLLSQLYHQIELIQFHKSRADHLEKELEIVRDAPRDLDDALRRISNLREEIAGRKEIEMDLRRRLEILDDEEQRKTRHILRLEKMLNRIWARPHNRFGRFVKRMLRFGRPAESDRRPKPEGDVSVARRSDG